MKKMVLIVWVCVSICSTKVSSFSYLNTFESTSEIGTFILFVRFLQIVFIRLKDFLLFPNSIKKVLRLIWKLFLSFSNHLDYETVILCSIQQHFHCFFNVDMEQPAFHVYIAFDVIHYVKNQEVSDNFRSYYFLVVHSIIFFISSAAPDFLIPFYLYSSIYLYSVDTIFEWHRTSISPPLSFPKFPFNKSL